MSTTKLPLRTRAPRYAELAEQLKAMIFSGDMQPGDRMPSFSEMRARFDASPLTVDKMYARLEDEGLVVRRARSGCFVAEPPRTAKTGVLGLLGIQPSRRTDPYYSQILNGVQTAAFAANYEILLLNIEAPVPWQKMDALLFPSSSAKTLLKDRPSHFPCVSLLYPYPKLNSVVADDFEGARQATQHLLELGHRRIAYLTVIHHSVTRLRIAGYQQALHDAGIQAMPQWLRPLEREGEPQYYFREWGYASMQRWLQDDWQQLGCTALLAQNDWVAAGAMAALQEAGINVPQNVSLIGFDDLPICEYTTPSLSSVSVPLAEIAAAGVNLLLQQLNRPDALSGFGQPTGFDANLVLPTRFHARNSTAPP